MGKTFKDGVERYQREYSEKSRIPVSKLVKLGINPADCKVEKDPFAEDFVWLDLLSAKDARIVLENLQKGVAYELDLIKKILGRCD